MDIKQVVVNGCFMSSSTDTSPGLEPMILIRFIVESVILLPDLCCLIQNVSFGVCMAPLGFVLFERGHFGGDFVGGFVFIQESSIPDYAIGGTFGKYWIYTQRFGIISEREEENTPKEMKLALRYAAAMF